MLNAIKALKDKGFDTVPASVPGEDYLVLAVQPKSNARLCVRPLIAPHPKGLLFAMRVHLKAPKFPVAGTKWNDAYPGFGYTRKDDKRLASEVVVVIPRSPGEIAMLAKDFTTHGLPRKIGDYFADRVPLKHWKIKKAEFEQFIQAVVDEVATEAKSHTPKKVEAIKAELEKYEAVVAKFKAMLKEAIAAEAKGGEVDYVPLTGAVSNVGTEAELASYFG